MDTIESRVNTSKRFVGCVQELIINGYRYDFRRGGLVGDAEFGVNVGELLHQEIYGISFQCLQMQIFFFGAFFINCNYYAQMIRFDLL